VAVLPRPVRSEPCVRAELPRERLFRAGASALSAIELLALVIRTGGRGRSALETATRIWGQVGSWECLGRIGEAELGRIAGMGPAKIASLRAAVELGARALSPPLEPGTPLTGPEQVAQHLAPRIGALRQESFWTLMLDSRQRWIGEVEVSRGSLDQSLVHPREVFGPAVREAAAALVLVHNHPSGNPEPSPEDHEVTARLVGAGELLGIPVVDHVVLARQGYTSFARRGWLRAQAVERRRR